MDDQDDPPSWSDCSPVSKSLCRALFSVTLIFNVHYLLNHFPVGELKDFISLIAIMILFRCMSKTDKDRGLACVFVLLMSTYNLFDFYNCSSVIKPADASSATWAQLLLLFIIFLFSKKPRICWLLIAPAMFIKVLELAEIFRKIFEFDGKFWKIYETYVTIYFDEFQALLCLLMCLGTVPDKIFRPSSDENNAKNFGIRETGMIGLMEQKLSITESFRYFLPVASVLVTWNWYFHNLILTSLVQAFGMVCLVWLLAGLLLGFYQLAMPEEMRDEYIRKISKLEFFGWFLAIVLYERPWRLNEFEKQMNAISISLVVMVVYFLDSHRILFRAFADARANGVLNLKGKLSLCLRNNSILVFVLFFFSIALSIGCCVFVGDYSPDVILLIFFNVKFLLSLLEDGLLFFNTKEFKIVVNLTLDGFVMLFLWGHMAAKMLRIGWVSCFEIVNLLWLNQFYVCFDRVRNKWRKLCPTRVQPILKLTRPPLPNLWHESKTL